MHELNILQDTLEMSKMEREMEKEFMFGPMDQDMLANFKRFLI